MLKRMFLIMSLLVQGVNSWFLSHWHTYLIASSHCAVTGKIILLPFISHQYAFSNGQSNYPSLQTLCYTEHIEMASLHYGFGGDICPFLRI